MSLFVVPSQPYRLAMDIPFRDGWRHIVRGLAKKVDQAARDKIPYEAFPKNWHRRVELITTGFVLLIPIINIIVDNALRRARALPPAPKPPPVPVVEITPSPQHEAPKSAYAVRDLWLANLSLELPGVTFTGGKDHFAEVTITFDAFPEGILETIDKFKDWAVGFVFHKEASSDTNVMKLVQKVENFPKVKSFYAIYNLTNAGVQEVFKLTGLKTLELVYLNEVTDEAMQGIRKLTQLEVLRVLYCQKLTGGALGGILQLKNLQQFIVDGWKELSDEAAKTLTQLKKLERLYLYGCKKVTASTWEHLKGAIKTVSNDD